MNYIRQFMIDNQLVSGQPFRISPARNLWFCFTDDNRIDLCVDDDIMRACTNFDNILLRLLSGEIYV